MVVSSGQSRVVGVSAHLVRAAGTNAQKCTARLKKQSPHLSNRPAATSNGPLKVPGRGAGPARALTTSCRQLPVRGFHARLPAGDASLLLRPRLATSRPSYWRFVSSVPPIPRSGEDGSPSAGRGRGDVRGGSGEPSIGWKMLEAAAMSLASIAVLGLGFGMASWGYHYYYKSLVLRKMEVAFAPGDPVLELAAMGRGMPQRRGGSGSPVGNDGDFSRAGDDDDGDGDGGVNGSGHYWIQRPEQVAVDRIVAGHEVGHYHLFIGEKGTGKSSMLLMGMAKVNGEGVAMFDAHADLEIFRIRLGKALNYEYYEDYIGSYFSERGPRDTTALLDIERALNKLEKVALRRRRRQVEEDATAGPGGFAGDAAASVAPPSGGVLRQPRPLVVIVNQMHLIRDDEDGRDLIELLQQRAEQWAAAGLVTMVFNSDDFWVYERLKQLAARLEVHSIQDLPRPLATLTLKRYRQRYFGEHVDDALANAVFDRVGGRLTFLNRVARSHHMLATCGRIVQSEKTWFLNQCWILGADMDDDVMDQQKWASAAMVLALALVDRQKEEKEKRAEGRPTTGQSSGRGDDRGGVDTGSEAALERGTGAGADAGPEADADADEEAEAETDEALPSFALHEAQQIMTRVDFVRELDRRNLFTITSHARVRAASVPMQDAMRDICGAPDFREYLAATIQRIADIESLGRTRELVAKDLVLGGRYDISAGGEHDDGSGASTTDRLAGIWKGERGGSGRGKKLQVRFHGWSPHERPPRDPPEEGK